MTTWQPRTRLTTQLRTMVCFRVGGVSFWLPVEASRAVRGATGIGALPAPRPDIAAPLPAPRPHPAGPPAAPPPVPVVCALGNAGRQILLVEVDGTTFGLLV